MQRKVPAKHTNDTKKNALEVKIKSLAGEIARAPGLPFLEPRRPRRGLLFFCSSRRQKAGVSGVTAAATTKPEQAPGYWNGRGTCDQTVCVLLSDQSLIVLL